MGAAVSLGITRFAYALLLPPMRSDLGWSYALAGAMNTSNAAGYLAGALCTPALLRRVGPGALMWWGSLAASVVMGVSALFTDTTAWLALRLVAGVASAFVFIAGGVLAAGLGTADPARVGLLLGIYYGGTGAGITLSALLVTWVLAAASGSAHGWAWAWAALALLCLIATALLRWPARLLKAPTRVADESNERPPLAPARIRAFAFALAGYTMFGMGYIGYMTFVVALLREQGQSAARITLFYALLGLAVMLSPRLWAGLLDRFRDGRPQALLNALLGIATILPALSGAWPLVLASGLLFGGVFLSVVASTTALVRHNLPPARWAAGIGAFTIVFAGGQIVGPMLVGLISDGPGGLARGFVVSAFGLWAGAALAWWQKPLARR